MYSATLTTLVKKRSWGNASKKRVFTRRLVDAALHATQLIKKGRDQWAELCREHDMSDETIEAYFKQHFPIPLEEIDTTIPEQKEWVEKLAKQSSGSSRQSCTDSDFPCSRM